MIKNLKPKSEFTKNVLTLMTGTTVAQAIPIAISPILTRIYSPEDFGIFALFLAIASIFGSIANGKYELAIMTTKKDENAINIFALGVILTTIISLFLMILVILLNDYFVKILKSDDISMWLYFIPITVFFIGLFNVLTYYNIRKKCFKDISKATIIKSVVLAITQLTIGFLKDGASGLISGEIISRIFSNLRLFKNIIKDKLLLSKISRLKIIAVARRYKKYPQLTLWATLSNILSNHSISIYISFFYSVTTLGFYSLAERVLGSPLALIGKSISQVYFQDATNEFHTKGTIVSSFNSTFKKLVIVGIPIFSILFFIIEDLFAFVFGEDWRVAGVYAQVLIFLYFARFIVSPLTITPMIINNLKIDFVFQVVMLIIIVVVSLISFVFKLDIMTYIYMISFIYGGYYLIYLLILSSFTKNSSKKIVLDDKK